MAFINLIHGGVVAAQKLRLLNLFNQNHKRQTIHMRFKDTKEIIGKTSELTLMLGKMSKEDVTPAYMDVPQGELNMEASVSADDVVRAGGFGARDDISNFLPAASYFAHFEASLLDARGYEEPKEEISGPGLGWMKF